MKWPFFLWVGWPYWLWYWLYGLANARFRLAGEYQVIPESTVRFWPEYNLTFMPYTLTFLLRRWLYGLVNTRFWLVGEYQVITECLWLGFTPKSYGQTWPWCQLLDALTKLWPFDLALFPKVMAEPDLDANYSPDWLNSDLLTWLYSQKLWPNLTLMPKILCPTRAG